MDSSGELVDSNPKVTGENLPESGGHLSHAGDYYFRRGTTVKIMLLFLAAAVLFLGLSRSSDPSRQFFQSSYQLFWAKESLTNATNLSSQNLPSLEKMLREAAMEDKKTVIITTLNAAWTEPDSIFDLFIESFKIGNGTEKLLRHLVVGTLDQTAYSRCLEMRFLHCYNLTTQGVDFSREAFFMSEDYLKVVWRKIDFQREVLEMGFNFIFTDADIMWLRDPFERFYPRVDFQIACDHYWFNSTDRNNSPNSGFSHALSNSRTVRFYKFWYESRLRFPGKHDQDVLNMIKFDQYVQEIGLEMRFLDTAHFGGFCEPSKDLDLVVTMHANCCIGLGNKVHDIKMVIDDWKKYMSLPSGERNLSSRSWTVPRICG